MRKQFGDPHCPGLRAVAACRNHLEVATRNLCRLQDGLTAAPARSDQSLTPENPARPDMAPGNGNSGDPIEPERLLGRGQRGELCADSEPIAGILHIRPDRDLAVDRFDRAADAESGIGRVSGQSGRARLIHQLLRAARHRNGGSSKLRNLREWSWVPSRWRIRKVSMPIRKCWLIARS